jgi:hypothetical protein
MFGMHCIDERSEAAMTDMLIGAGLMGFAFNVMLFSLWLWLDE